MRVGSGPPRDSASNWIVLGAMLVAFVGLVGIIFKLQEDGARYTEAFVRQNPASVMLDARLLEPLDAVIHEASADAQLETERRYVPFEELEARWERDQPEVLIWLRPVTESGGPSLPGPWDGGHRITLVRLHHPEQGLHELVWRTELEVTQGPLLAIREALNRPEARERLAQAGWVAAEQQ